MSADIIITNEPQGRIKSASEIALEKIGELEMQLSNLALKVEMLENISFDMLADLNDLKEQFGLIELGKSITYKPLEKANVMLEKFEKNLLISITGRADKSTINELIDDIIAAADNITSNANIVNPHLKVSEVVQQDSTTYERF